MYLTARQVGARYAISKRTVWRWAATGKLPKPHELTEGTTRWLASDLADWDLARRRAKTS